MLTDDLRQILAEVPDTPLGKRDRALLLLGFAGAFRRSELVALDVADLEDNCQTQKLNATQSMSDKIKCKRTALFANAFRCRKSLEAA